MLTVLESDFIYVDKCGCRVWFDSSQKPFPVANLTVKCPRHKSGKKAQDELVALATRACERLDPSNRNDWYEQAKFFSQLWGNETVNTGRAWNA